MIQVSTLSKKNDLSQQRNADLSPMQVSPVCTSPTIRHQNSRAINITTIRNQQTVLQPFNVLQGEEDSNQSANACKSQWLPIYSLNGQGEENFFSMLQTQCRWWIKAIKALSSGCRADSRSQQQYNDDHATQHAQRRGFPGGVWTDGTARLTLARIQQAARTNKE